MKRLRALKVLSGAGLMAAIVIGAEVSQAVAEGFMVAEENQMTDQMNAHRAQHGLAPLAQDPALQMVARRQAQRMVAAGYIYHNPDLARESAEAVPDWLRLGENVGVGGDVTSVSNAFLASPPHHANVDNQYTIIGLGAMPSGGSLYFTQNFAARRGAPAARSAPPRPAPSVVRAAPCRGRACPRPARARRARRARVRGVQLVRAVPAGSSWSADPGGARGVSLGGALGGMLRKAGGKLVP